MTTSPFLTSSPILLRRSLGIGLANLRQRAGLHQREAAERLSVQRATIGHYESGRNLPSVGDLEALLRLYGAEDQIEHFRALRDGARRGENWWQKIAQIPSWFDHYLGLESGAASIDSFDTMYLPGLLQTEAYAEAMFHAHQRFQDDQIHQLVRVRRQRRHILDREERPAQLRVVLDESVLYRRQGDRDVMQAQLRALLDDIEHERITLRILPLDVGSFSGQHDHPFKLLTFPENMIGDQPVVYVELLGEPKYYEEAGEIELYQQAMADLLNAAADLRDSRTLVERAAKEAAK
ncbi:helix-turn-helix domain-containing protein [Saccharopolyspora rosea]|uniref:Helix-turn-helix domain-containing protein n=1 Tax=Saccharopolyspora rosea TaxID=524884 RepID=A0ABW3FVJ3_9PSEU|nr:helix-turn-helix transcriptional regulator [Saccharopolyspora rosea]